MKSEKVVCGCDVEKKKKEAVHVVLQVDLHCDGCIARIVRFAACLEGVETVRADPVANKLTLIGFMDPVKTAEKLQKETKKKVELLSPKPKNETKDAKADVKTTMIAVSTVTLKLSCSCDGCIKRIHKTISKTKGVYQVKIDREKDVVSVTGTMEVKTVTETLKRKLKKTIQVVPENKDKKKESAEGISKSGSPGLPCYGFGYGLGPYGFMGGPTTELFSEEDPNSCCIV
ncbi:hypothetical protein Bca52824_010139 [Brassica carinata]|uniref:HMA domain-containing protein n=1 Tax=Brassica carinata TaxID=52824 RepID=A0A8X7WCP0_BRACI|nr:hypothetical protein Bca52824_010139 [Brassica carinata]